MNTRKNEVALKGHPIVRIAFALGVLPACAALLTGCGRKPLMSPPVSEDPSIVVIAGEPSGNWKAARHGAMDAGKKLGVKIEWYAPRPQMPNANPPQKITPEKQQANWMVEATKRKVIGIAVAPMNPTHLVAAINNGGRKLVPALVYDSPAYTKEALTFVKNDDRAAGVLAAQQIMKIAGRENRVWVAAAAPDTGGEVCAESFITAMKKNGAAMQIASIASGDAVPPGVLFAPDEATSRAVLKKISPQTTFIASGSSEDLIAGLKSGKISALIVPDRYQMTFQSVLFIINYRANRPTQIASDVEIAPVLVTKENLSSEKSQRLLGLDSQGIK